MTSIAYFELQAKNLFQDYETKIPYVDIVDGNSYYKYDPNHFDIDRIICEYDCDEDNFSLIEAQDIIAFMAGFDKWADLLQASETELKLAKLQFDNQDIIHIEDWNMYIASAESNNQLTFDHASRLEIFKLVFINGGIFENPKIEPIAYFKKQAKHLFNAYKTKASNPFQKYGNEDEILLQYGYDKENFCLMKAQHIIAILIGFNKWADLLKASEAEMELAQLIFVNPHKVCLQEWKLYIDAAERNTRTTFDPESRLKILKKVFLNKGGFENPFGDYRLDHNLVCVKENKNSREAPKLSHDMQTVSLLS